MWNVVLFNFGWNFFAKYWHVCHCIVYFLNMLGQLLWILDVTDVVVTIGLPPLDAVGRCYLPCGCIMADAFCHSGTFVCLWKMKTTFE